MSLGINSSVSDSPLKQVELRKIYWKVSQNCLKQREATTLIYKFPLPGHSAVDSKIERIGKANKSIDDENDVFDNMIIHETEAHTRTDR